MQKVIDFIYRRPVFVSMLTLGFFLFGSIAFFELHFSLFPDKIYPGLTIKLDYPGADAIKIEKLITWPIEDTVSLVGGIREIRSYTETGKVKINLEFEKNVDLDFKTLQIKERIDLIANTFPREAHSPGIFRYDPSQVPVMIISFNSKKFGLTEIREQIEKSLKSELENISGVSQVAIAGGRIREVVISCDREQLEAYRISLRDVSIALARNNVNRSVAKIFRAGKKIKIYSFGRFKDIYEIRNLPVSRAYGKKPVQIQDIADVQLSFRDKDNSSRINGNETVSLYIYKTFSGDILQMSKNIFQILNQIYLPQVDYTITYNKGKSIQKVYHNIWWVFLFGFLLVSIYITNQVKDSFPFFVNLLSFFCSFLIICFFLYLFKLPYNLLVLCGIGFAIFFWSYFFLLVRSYPRRGHFPRGYHSFAYPLLFYAILLLVFPILLMIFHYEMAESLLIIDVIAILFFLSCYFLFPIFFILLPRNKLTFSYSLINNKLFHLTIPKKVVLSYQKKVNLRKIVKYRKWFLSVKEIPAYFYSLIFKLYEFVLNNLKYRKWLYVILLIISIYALVNAKKQIHFSTKEKELIAYLEFPPGTGFKFTDKITKTVEKKILGLAGIKQVITKVDPGKSFLIIKVFNDVVTDYKYTNYLKKSIGNTKPAYLFFSTDSGLLTTREVIIDVTGIELKQLREYTMQLSDRVKNLTDIEEVVLMFKPPRDELLLFVTTYRSWISGLTLPEIGDFLKLAIQGGIATKFINENREVDVRVRFAKKYRKSKDSLALIRIKNHDGHFVPISEIARRKMGSIPMKIYHKNKRRMFSFSIRLADISNRKILAILQKITSVPLAENYSISVGKRAGRQAGGKKEYFMIAFIFLPLFIYIAMAGYYESFLKVTSVFFISSVLILLLLSIYYFWTYFYSFPSFISIFISGAMFCFLFVVIQENSGIRFSKHIVLQSKKRKRKLFFYHPFIGSSCFLLPIFLFSADTAIFIYDFLFIQWLTLAIFSFFIPVFRENRFF